MPRTSCLPVWLLLGLAACGGASQAVPPPTAAPPTPSASASTSPAASAAPATSSTAAPDYVVFQDDAYGIRLESARALRKSPTQAQELTTPQGVKVTVSGYAAVDAEAGTLTLVNVQVIQGRTDKPLPDDMSCKNSLGRFFSEMQKKQIECASPDTPPTSVSQAPGLASTMSTLGACKEGNLTPTLRVLCDDRTTGRVVFVALLGQEKAASDAMRHFLCSPQMSGTALACP
jgi:hypothetical protein